MNNNHGGLEQIVPRQCELRSLIDGELIMPCPHTAYWQYNGTAVCLPDMKIMARMNSDNQEVFALALAPQERPLIVCLCGSTRFMQAFQEANLRETLAGHIVLTVGCDTKSDEMLSLTDKQKAMLDELHKRKIDLADEVLVLNVGGYIGSSTASEIDYARAQQKRIRWLEGAE